MLLFNSIIQISGYFIYLPADIHAILNRLVHDEPDLRGISHIDRMCQLTADIALRTLQAADRILLAFLSPRTLIYALHVFKSGATSTATTEVIGATLGSLIPLRMMLPQFPLDLSVYTCVFDTVLSHCRSFL